MADSLKDIQQIVNCRFTKSKQTLVKCITRTKDRICSLQFVAHSLAE